MRYGNHAMETLINDIVKRGGDRRRFDVKVFGGANVIESRAARPVGSCNVAFIERYLADEGFHVAAKHLGGVLPRRIHYFPTTGRVKMLLLRRSQDNELFRRELDYSRKVEAKDAEGSIELFE
jgi:chemotaxis protein CheD